LTLSIVIIEAAFIRFPNGGGVGSADISRNVAAGSGPLAQEAKASRKRGDFNVHSFHQFVDSYHLPQLTRASM
jgi:hypothetical protein